MQGSTVPISLDVGLDPRKRWFLSDVRRAGSDERVRSDTVGPPPISGRQEHLLLTLTDV
jgi:hypothetical protein